LIEKQHAAARELTSRGVRLFPQDRNKHPTIKGWPDKATTEKAQLSQWSSDFPTANWAAITGEKSGILVLDVDVKNDQPGIESFRRLTEKFGEIETYRVATPSGGFHLYLKYPEGQKIRNSELADFPGIEVKATGGCVTIAGSFYASGAEYRIDHDGEFAACPDWLIKLAKQRKPAKRETTDIISPEKSARIPEGQRNTELTSLAGKLRHDGLSAQTIFITLSAENQRRCNPPLPDTEVRSISDSVSQYEVAQVFVQADLGNANRLVHRHGRDIRYCFDTRHWLVWTGSRWADDRQSLIQGKADEMVHEMYQSAYSIDNEKEAKKQSAWALQSQNRSRLDSMIALAQAKVPIEIDKLDADPMLIGVENGYVDLKTGELLPAERGRYVTKIAAVEYDAEAKAPRWLQFLDEIFAGNTELIEFVQRAVGYSLTGDTREQCFFLLHGRGRNGKSTFIETLLSLLGPHAMATQPETIMMTRRDSGSASPELAAMPGIRLLSTVETQENRRLNESLVKQLVGGDRITARKLYADFFQFYPEFKLWLASNYLPEIKDTSYAMWRRIRLVPFDVQFTDETDDQDLKRKLLAELPGILTWAVQGCRAWQRDGLTAPASVLKATVEYQHSQDPIADFIDERIELSDVFVSTKAEVYRTYETWCKKNGEIPLSNLRLTADLKARGWIDARLHGGIRSWKGVAVRGGTGDENEIG
jgi:putative DNA primase/helicase